MAAVGHRVSAFTARAPRIDDVVISLYQAGQTAHQAAEACATSVNRVWRILKRNNVPRRPRVRKGTSVLAARDCRIVESYRGGKTLQATGAVFGITRERVRQILVQAGAPSRRAARFPDAVGDTVAQLYQGGKTIEAAATAVGVSAFTARNMLIERGIERRTSGSSAYRPASVRRRDQSMARLYQQGKTFEDVAKAFQTSTTSVQRALDRMGIARRGRQKKKNSVKHR